MVEILNICPPKYHSIDDLSIAKSINLYYRGALYA